MSVSVKIATLTTPNQSYEVNYVRRWGLTLTPPNSDLVDNNGNLQITAELWAAQDKARHGYLRAHALNGQTLCSVSRNRTARLRRALLLARDICKASTRVHGCAAC